MARSRSRALKCQCPSGCFEPVSYTHLDVYKRQGGSGPKELLEIVTYQNNGTVTNPGGDTVAYLKLFTQNPVSGTTIPFMEIPVVNNKTAPFQRFVFGDNVGNGLIPQTEDSSGNLDVYKRQPEHHHG